jgi:hypothetical protein
MNILRLACRRESRVRLRVRTFRSKMQAIGDRFGWAHLPSRRRTPFSPCSPRVDLNAGPNRGKDVSGDSVTLSRLYLSKQWGLREHFIARLLFISTSSFRADLLLHGLADQPCNSDCSGSSVAFQGEIQLYNCTEPQRLISIYRFTDNVQTILLLLLKDGGTSGARAGASPSVRRR